MLTINSDALKIEVRKHIEADAVIGGSYWKEKEQEGCFIGCLAHSDDIAILAKKYGFTPMFVRLVEDIFEDFRQAKRVQFFSDIGENMRDGVDTEIVTWTVLRRILERMPDAPEIATVIDLLKRVEAGESRHGLRDEFSAAAYAALAAADADAADAALAAADAAYAAARYAAYAAFAAAAAALAAARAAYAAAAAALAAARAAYAARAAAYAAERDQQAADVIAAIKNARCETVGTDNEKETNQ